MSVVQQAGKLGAQGKGRSTTASPDADSRLSIFSDPHVAVMTHTTTFPLASLREQARPCTVYWHVPFRDQARLRRLTRLFSIRSSTTAQERFLLDRPGRRVTAHPLLWVAEELPSLGYFPMASSGLNYFRAYNIQMLLLTPSMQELVKEFGQYHNFLEGSYVQVIFGLSDAKTGSQFAEAIGKREVARTRTTRHKGGVSASTEAVQEALLDTTGILQLPPGRVLILVGVHRLVGNHAPFYGHRLWRERSALPVP